MDPHAALRSHLIALLDGGSAHVTFDAAVDELPESLRGVRPGGLPHSAWRLVEHLRIAQRDILDFSRNGHHVSPDWPDGYWPEGDAPPSPAAWDETLAAFRADLAALKAMVADPSVDLFAAIAGGKGQTVLREALLVADHNAYHIGQLIVVRRLLGAWDEGSA